MPRKTNLSRRTQPRRPTGGYTPEEAPKTTEQLARQLVTRGLASVRILDNPASYRMDLMQERKNG